MNQNDFPEKLIKGRIAETVFELMFREGTDYDVFPLGYEYTTPILVQFKNHPDAEHKEIIKKVLENFEDTPDFMLVNPDKSEIYLVEVKFRTTYEPEELLKIAQDIKAKWKPSHLFLATSDRFYYDSCQTIINNNGQINPLKESRIVRDKQIYYHNLLMRFEKK